jgi:hypothetical protein
MLVDIKIPMFKALLDVQTDATPEIPVDVGTIVVMTQSCDLENRKAPKGVDQRMTDRWVGHQTEEMRRRYTHLFPDAQREAVASVFAGR